jgi:hypothetical protein
LHLKLLVLMGMHREVRKCDRLGSSDQAQAHITIIVDALSMGIYKHLPSENTAYFARSAAVVNESA